MSRREEVAAGLDSVRGRIESACAAAGRDAEEVTLVVVTKFFPASDVRLLADLGVRHVGENRHQEAEAKAGECADLPLVWHFIGGLQSNKAAAVASYAQVVESVDRPSLLAPLGAAPTGRPPGRRAAARSAWTRRAARTAGARSGRPAGSRVGGRGGRRAPVAAIRN